MKLLRDFIRLRTAGRFSASGRPAAVRRAMTVTVPQPLSKTVAAPAHIDMHWQTQSGQGRPSAHWHEHVSADTPSRHLKLVSSL